MGWLGTFVVYPAWAIWLASVETRLAGRSVLLQGSTQA